MVSLLKKSLLFIFAAFSIWVISVGLYFYLIPAAPLTPTEQMQLSRIDFKQELSAEQGDSLRAFVATLPSVKSSYFNDADNILVYTYTVGAQNSKAVFEAIQSVFNYQGERYLVSTEQAKSGCPISQDRRDFSYRFVNYFITLF